MNRKILIALVAVTGILVAAVPAGAQTNWAGSAYLGFATATNDGAPGGSIGGRVNAFNMVHSVIGIGGEFGIDRLGSETFSSGVSGTVKDELSEWHATANVIAQGITGKVRPFAIGGLGVYRLKITREQIGLPDVSVSESNFGFNLGGGLKFRPGPAPVSFGVEARWHVIPGANFGVTGESVNMVTVMGGLNFR